MFKDELQRGMQESNS